MNNSNTANLEFRSQCRIFRLGNFIAFRVERGQKTTTTRPKYRCVEKIALGSGNLPLKRKAICLAKEANKKQQYGVSPRGSGKRKSSYDDEALAPGRKGDPQLDVVGKIK